MLKKEVQKTQGEDGEKNSEYRSMLINAIHQAAIRFPESASTVVPVLMDFLGDSNQVLANVIAHSTSPPPTLTLRALPSPALIHPALPRPLL